MAGVEGRFPLSIPVSGGNMSYFDTIESFNVIEDQDGRKTVDQFPRFIGVTCDLLEHGDLDSMALTLSFTFSNGGASYQVITRERGFLVCERTAYASEGVTYG